MRKYLWIAPIAAAAAVVVAQSGAGQAISNYAKALSEANTLKAKFTVMRLDGAPATYNIDLAKPNMARIDTPGELIVADGTNVIRYSKGEKTYYKEPQTEEVLEEILGQDAFGLVNAFFSPDAVTKATARATGTVNRNGKSLSKIEAIYGDGKKTVVFYVGSDNLAHQAEVSYADGKSNETLILNAKSIELGVPAASNLFAFSAPAGSRELSMEELTAAKWFTDLEEAKKVAAKTNRKIFVDFMATWCGPCKMLDAEVLQTEGFKKYSRQLVFVKIDVDLQPAVSKHYNVTAMPTQMVLAADGSVIKSTVGYGGPGPFYAFINGALGQ
jgi:thiol-disulfide isomerase/thioredoxin